MDVFCLMLHSLPDKQQATHSSLLLLRSNDNFIKASYMRITNKRYDSYLITKMCDLTVGYLGHKTMKSTKKLVVA